MPEYSINPSYAASFLAKAEEVMRLIRMDQSQKLDAAVLMLLEAWQQNRPVFIMGNGGSASTATHLASDLVKTICDSPTDRGVRAQALVDNIPLVSATVNDWGWENLYTGQLATVYEAGGVGIAFSVHGGAGRDLSGAWSQNLLKGLQYIKDRGGKTIGFSGFDGGAMKDLVDISLVVPADSTPVVEGLHVVLHHLLVFGLKQKIQSHKKLL